MATTPGGPVDFLVITALEEERDAMLAKLDGATPVEKGQAELFTYYIAEVRSARAEQQRYRVVVAQLLEMGPVQAAVQTAAAVTRWQPHAVILVGIAAGVAGVSDLGDVLVARQVVDYTLGKVETSRRSLPLLRFLSRSVLARTIRWESYRADPTLLDSAAALKGWARFVMEDRPGSGSPTRVLGTVASGPNVIADGEEVARFKNSWPKLVGMEMEGGGVASALHHAVSHPRFLMVKGVSDLADSGKNSPAVRRWRHYACDVAAAFVRALLESSPLVPVTGGPAPSNDTQGTRADGWRARDLGTLRQFWETIPTSELDHFFERATLGFIPDSVLFYSEGVHGLYNASSFQVFDSRLKEAIGAFVPPFLKSLAMSEFFSTTTSGHEHHFMRAHQHTSYSEWKASRDRFDGLVRDARTAFRSLVALTKAEWPEIDLEQADDVARRERVAYEERLYRDDTATGTGDAPDEASLEKAKTALLAMARAAVVAFVSGSEEQEVSLLLETDLERRAAALLAAEGKAVVDGDSCRITVWRKV